MYAEVILKRKLPAPFDTLTYQVGNVLVKPGQAVVLPFGKSRTTGIVTAISTKKPDYKLKDILGALGEEILLKPWQIELARWISQYYLCPLSKVIPLFLPKKAWMLTGLQKSLKRNFSVDGVVEERAHIHTLTPAQKNILRTIETREGEKFLIHGVTGSGKTEIYLRLAKNVLDQERQVLFLVPEIALTPQLIDFIRSYFPKTPLSVIHSKLTEKERDASWLSIYSGETKIVVGSRSALFSPFQKLGLIVMDEEHEWTYKQEQTPRYHARKVVEKMAELTGATLVLGSATPDVSTYYETLEKKGKAGSSRYAELRLLCLPERISETPLPQTTVIDMRDEIKKKNFSIFSDLLREKLAQTLVQKKQAILFLNRRGTSPALLCRDCGYVTRCSECQVAMVMHRLESSFILICHHCGKRKMPENLCPHCMGNRIKGFGIGTERVEEEVQKLFSLTRVFRADSDTILKKADYHTLYEKLKNHEIDILVGTQMIAKGLDLPQVHFVGVVLADTSLHFPDFRAAERTFQLLTQVSGRAGRRKEQGEVIIQTYNPEHYAIEAASRHDYKTFYEKEIKVRQELLYPPFSKIIRLKLSHENREICLKEIATLEEKLRTEAKKQKSEDIRIAAFPSIIPKLHGKYHFEILIRGNHPENLLKNLVISQPWSIDVDPLN